MSRRFVKPSFDTLPTRFLYVAGIYNDMGTDDSTLISVFSRFGPLEDPYVEMIEGKRFCFVIFCNVSDAIKARDELRDQPIENLSGTNKVIIKYAKEYEFHPVPESEPSIKHNEVSIPGLVFIEDFLTEDEEQVLLEGLCIESNPTWMLALNRRVQHYGFSFNYRTLLLDYTAETPPFPSDVTCNGFLEKLQCVSGGVSSSFGDSDHPINQITVNEYLPGQGIASHTDATTCFGPVICILSLASEIAMTFIDRSATTTLNSTNDESFDSSDSPEDPVSSPTSTSGNKRVSVWLPRRSLMVMAGPARYNYSHGIAARRTDKYNGVTIERSRRVSLTFRQAIIPGAVPAEKLQVPVIERQFVMNVYDSIAEHWHHTRGKRKVHWHSVKAFLESLPNGTLLADVGCGDGKYFDVNPNVITIGCDMSLNLLQVSKTPTFDTFCSDAVKIPLRSDSFDAVICIAVLHHISTVDRRVAIIRELVRIVKPDGFILLQAWAREQESEAATGNRHFDFASSESQDVFVPWTLPSRFKLSVEPIKTASTSDEEFKSNEITLESVSRTALVKQQVEDSDHTAIVDKFERRRQRNERKREKTRLKLESRSQTDIPFKPRGDEDKNGGSMPSPSIAESSHVIDQPHNDREVLQRYCHVYARGELEDICSSIPNCRLIESGYDRGNWFVKLKRINDERLVRAFIGTEASMPIIAARSLVKR